VEPRGFEPRSSACKAEVFPLLRQPQGSRTGIRTPLRWLTATRNTSIRSWNRRRCEVFRLTLSPTHRQGRPPRGVLPGNRTQMYRFTAGHLHQIGLKHHGAAERNRTPTSTVQRGRSAIELLRRTGRRLETCLPPARQHGPHTAGPLQPPRSLSGESNSHLLLGRQGQYHYARQTQRRRPRQNPVAFAPPQGCRAAVVVGTRRGIRTPTALVLSQSPLPLG
jgi:hypothetical protein